MVGSSQSVAKARVGCVGVKAEQSKAGKKTKLDTPHKRPKNSSVLESDISGGGLDFLFSSSLHLLPLFFAEPSLTTSPVTGAG